MVAKEPNNEQNELYYRLIAFWVVCEAFAGGLMHAVKLPFAGMLINALAVVCVILIGSHIKKRGAILKATIIVAIFKFILSPYSPPTAYIAVGFQGILGALLFQKTVTRTGAIILASVTLVESAMQRLLVLLIIYGNGFWKALNIYISKLTGEKDVTDYSLMIAGLYVAIHAITGLFIGNYAYRMVTRLQTWAQENPNHIFESAGKTSGIVPMNPTRKKRIKLFVLFIWLLLIALALHSLVDPKSALLSNSEVMQIIIRAGLIITTWQLIILPGVTLLLRRMMEREKQRRRQDMEAVSQIIPEMKYIFFESWRRSYELKGFSRLKLCLRIMLANVLKTKASKDAHV